MWGRLQPRWRHTPSFAVTPVLVHSHAGALHRPEQFVATSDANAYDHYLRKMPRFQALLARIN
jgi:hypothetical protein